MNTMMSRIKSQSGIPQQRRERFVLFSSLASASSLEWRWCSCDLPKKVGQEERPPWGVDAGGGNEAKISLRDPDLRFWPGPEISFSSSCKFEGSEVTYRADF